MKNIEIPTDQQHAVFKKHLNEPDNERIIFSGAFGTGKTYFLRKFFDVQKQEYLTVRLAPVNYSISSNEDIFKLIKFDILFELLAHHGVEQPGKIRIRRDIFLGLTLPGQLTEFLTNIAGVFGALNKDVQDTMQALVALQVVHQQLEVALTANPEVPENEAVNDFLKQMMSAYLKEADDVTAFIEQTLTELASTGEGNPNRQKVLVIDDLDRLDPEHIFRLFNVFSAHFDYLNSSHNKFGFDKVVFVCDIRNIRNIFHSRYGTTTDFSGYIDKFFSQEVFYFNNEQAIKEFIDNLLSSIRIEGFKEYGNYFSSYILKGRNYSEKSFVFWLLFELVVSGALKPRRIFASHKPLAFPNDKVRYRGTYGMQEVHVNQMPIISSLRLASSILGGGEHLLLGVKHAASQPRSQEYQDLLDKPSFISWLFGQLLIIDYEVHKFKIAAENHAENQLHLYKHPDGKSLTYIVGEWGERRSLYDSSVKDNPDNLTLFDLLPIMVQKLLDAKLL